jgi:rRNA processing protein Krr1/Pno1
MKRHDSHKSDKHRKHSRSRSRSRDRDRGRREKRKSKFDDPNPERLPDFQLPPGVAEDANSALNPNRVKWTMTHLDPKSRGAAMLLSDPNKIKRKVFLPTETTVNYVGLIIGPRGLEQKKLEEQTGCRILIRGKGVNFADASLSEEEQHVLIVGDDEQSVNKAETIVNSLINADEETREAIRKNQLQNIEEPNSELYGAIDDSLLTPYGLPSTSARILKVPDDCVGLIIGKGGETIRKLQQESGAKIQVAKKEIAQTGMRNVFIEGAPERYENARRLIEAILEEHRENMATAPQSHTVEYPIPGNVVGLLLGKGGDNLKRLTLKTKASIYVPRGATAQRIVQIRGSKAQITQVKKEIDDLIAIAGAASKADMKAQVRNKQQAVEAISMYLPQSITEVNLADISPEDLEETKRQQELQAQVATNAGLYQQYFANYDPLYADYFQRVTLGSGGVNAAAAVQAAQERYATYYNDYLTSGYLPPQNMAARK